MTSKTLRRVWLASLLVWVGLTFKVQHDTAVATLENERLRRECACTEVSDE